MNDDIGKSPKVQNYADKTTLRLGSLHTQTISFVVSPPRVPNNRYFYFTYHLKLYAKHSSQPFDLEHIEKKVGERKEINWLGEFFHQKVFSLVSFYSAFPAAPPPPAQCDMEILSSSSSATLAGTGNGGDQQKTQQNYELQPVLRSPVGPPRKTLTMVTSSTGESFIPDYPDLLNIQQPPASNRPPISE